MRDRVQCFGGASSVARLAAGSLFRRRTYQKPPAIMAMEPMPTRESQGTRQTVTSRVTGCAPSAVTVTLARTRPVRLPQRSPLIFSLTTTFGLPGSRLANSWVAKGTVLVRVLTVPFDFGESRTFPTLPTW